MADKINLLNETLFIHTFENAITGLGLVSLDWHWLKVNPSLCKIVGYTEDELLKLTFLDITYSDDLESDLAFANRLILGEINSYQMEKRYIHKDGSIIWVLLNGSLVRNDQQEPLFFLSEVQDITKRKLAEFQLKESEQRYKSLFEHHPDLVYSISSERKLIHVNSACEKVTGYSFDGFMELPSIIAPEDRAKLSYHTNLAFQGLSQEYEISILHKLGHKVPLRITNLPIIVDEKIIGVYGIAKDVLEYKRKSEKLRKIEELYHLISENSQDIITIIDVNGICQFISPALYKVTGFKPHEVIGKPATDLWHVEDRQRIENLLDGFDIDAIVCRVRHKNGDYVWFESNINVIRDEKGNVANYLAICRNINERMQAEEEYRRLVEDSPDAIFISREDTLIYVNDAAVNLLCATKKSDLIGNLFYSFISGGNYDTVRERFQRVKSGETAELWEHDILRFDGQIVQAESKSIPITFKGESAIHTIIRDISDRKKTQDLLINSEKLAIAGQLAAGIAHEIRNPLTAIKGFLQLIHSGQPVKQVFLDVISEEMTRIEQILSELLLLAKPQELKKESVSIGMLLDQTITLLGPQANLRNIEIETRLSSGIPDYECDATKIKQVFINLIKNAIEATPTGGKVIVGVSFLNGDFINVTIIDSGCGIPKEHLMRLGEPFFTTKGKGTGLGLMVSRRIIENHGGEMNIHSVMGKGTTVTISLPLENRS